MTKPIENFDIEKHDEIQKLHIKYIDYVLFVEPTVKHIVNFNDYITKFYSMNRLYYLKLAEKYNFDLTR